MNEEIPHFHYTTKKLFLWVWGTVSEKGRIVRYGNKDDCERFADWLNTIWENGYIHGRRDEYRDAMKEINKLI